MQPDTILPARLDETYAVALAERLYGVRACARAMPGEYDDNFHLTAEDGAEFVLKIMHAARDRASVEVQCEAIEHIAQHAPELATPRVRASLAGRLLETAADPKGAARFVWMLTYIPGRPLAQTKPHAPALRVELGEFVARVDQALAGFQRPVVEREFKWDLARASWILDYVDHVQDPARRKLVETFMERYRTQALPMLARLRCSVIHGDANDHNVLTRSVRGQPPRIAGLIDFGDLHYGVTASGPAIAAAYALLHATDPLPAAAQVIAGYHRVEPLAESELEVMFALITARLCVSVVNSAHRKALAPDDPYITISEAPAWSALERLANVPPRLAHYMFRDACGLPAVPHSARVAEYLRENAATFAPVVADLADAQVFDLSVGSTWTGADPQALRSDVLGERIAGELRAAGKRVGVGRYGEARAVYTAPQFAADAAPDAERRTVHLGLDFFCEPGAPVYAPLAGRVHTLADNAHPQDYGPLVILEHETPAGDSFFTLYGHLSRDTLSGLALGQTIGAGERLGAVGDSSVNGGWPPHVHFQLSVDLLDLGAEFPGVALDSQRTLWQSLSPDPSRIGGIAPERLQTAAPALQDTLALRRRLLGGNLSVSYRRPLKIVRGWKQHLYDDAGRAYLDMYNNVPLVGHTHPHVVRAAQQQLALLNTNTRYLHDNIVRYAQRLTALMPEPLRVCYFLNSASEANELALRLARTYTRREDVITLEHAYHGHTTTLIDISPYKFNGPGGAGRKSWVHVAPLPDDYRGPYRRNDPLAGRKYAEHVAEIIYAGAAPAAYIAESLPSVGGQIVFPPEYLREAYKSVRAGGGVCIADEVQVGFGRLGEWFWGFESQGVVPDIVVLGKPIGNAFPVAAVVTTPEIAAAFDNGMEFFSTFGGNPVACAAGLAVLEVLEQEQLPQNAQRVGRSLKDGLTALMNDFPLIGDVRGMGLFLGVELVRNRRSLEPADEEASYIVNRLRDHGILAGTDGPYHNVIKLRPPLCFCEADVRYFLAALAQILAEDSLQV